MDFSVQYETKRCGSSHGTCHTALRFTYEKGDAFVFYGDLDPQIQWEGDARAELCLISRQEALNAWKVHLDQDYLVLSENYVWEENGELVVTGSGKP